MRFFRRAAARAASCLSALLPLLGALPAFAESPAPVAVAAPAATDAAGTVDGEGRPFDLAAGKTYRFVYFGYTHCPEICPTTLFEMKASLDLVDPKARGRVTPVFVTLDPARDTPASMSAYIAPLGGGFVTVSGPLEAIDRLAWAYQVVVVRNITDDPNYTIDHTTSTLLLAPGGRVVERFPFEMDYREVARRIQAHLTAAPLAAAAPPA